MTGILNRKVHAPALITALGLSLLFGCASNGSAGKLPPPPNGKAIFIKHTFSMQYGVSIPIKAKREKIWAVLTNGPAYPSWNSTVTGLKGEIALGKKIELKVRINPDRTFEPEILETRAPERMVWGSGSFIFRGDRVFTLKPAADGTVIFSMVEKFKGLMLPMIAGSLPDFRGEFERFAADLKKHCEQ